MKVSVIGSGTMGMGIAQIAASNDSKVRTNCCFRSIKNGYDL